jgi:hypothetical protein
MTIPAELPQADFARHMGWRPSYVVQLKREGRLVISEDGKRVRVAESIARIEATRDPAKQAVADRHAESRNKPKESSIDHKPKDGQGAEIGNTYQAARAVKERYNALQAKLDYQRAAGELIEVSAVAAISADAMTLLRNALEAIPDTLAPRIATVSDEQQIRAILAQEVEILLAAASARMEDLAK